MMDLNFWLISGLTLLHLHAGKLRFSDWIPTRYFLSMSGGVAIAYVFAEILPSLGEAQAVVEQAGSPGWLMRPIYFLALLGLTAFYGVDRLASQSHMMRETEHGTDIITVLVFWIHIGAFAVNNALFSYLLNHTARPIDCFLLFGAIALHYTLNVHGLRQHHKWAYDKLGRWVIAGAIFSGWILSEAIPVAGQQSVEISFLKAFLAGGIILNVLNHELPKQQDSHFWSFAAGAGIYASVLLMV